MKKIIFALFTILVFTSCATNTKFFVQKGVYKSGSLTLLGEKQEFHYNDGDTILWGSTNKRLNIKKQN